MSRPGQNAAAAHVAAMVRQHGGTWRPRLIDADFYDTPTAVALISNRVPLGRAWTMRRVVVGLLGIAFVVAVIWSCAYG